MVVGVGGGGSNAVNHMFRLGITDVSFVVCNTDRQALERSPIPTKIRLGDNLTGGLGAGNKPERGRQAALESLEDIKASFLEHDTKMVFVTAGMGGGTGTGAAPVIAKAAKDMGILTVAIVTIPFKTEGRKRIEQAIAGIEEISHCVDSLLVINNENIHEIHGELTLSQAFGKADDILATAAKSIAEIITSHYQVNVDFEDVRTVMKDSGVALMGSAQGAGDNRAMDVATEAMNSPLLNHKDISGAQNVLLNITSGAREVTLSETYQITEYIQERAGNNNATDLIWGAGQDESLGEDIRITVIATGFGMESIPALKERYKTSLGVEAQVIQPKPHISNRQVVNFEEQDQPTPKRKEAPTEDQDGFTVVQRNQESVTEFHKPEPQRVESQKIEFPKQSPIEELPSPTLISVVQEIPTPESADPHSIFNMTEEQIEAIPAWLRRKMKLETTGSKTAEHETLSTDNSSKGSMIIDLFE